ncbi:hypothetical protein NEUTE1DRAFT_108276 [Neurospora tetrasperma FGSC 2508]|uniref:Uncharacterized protein n=1 Tax=Neurospora tetrasperma (strain FGSC 2508 / ATCC MYA-4615 / P0657) TaxID=510951 RepID=F8MGV8_NEUT8|nr:uncharacterized protein NEUTE1DRAFT_108276 [Neurospora tetrasperma FGSC 2508]EGO58677.1 hypothetical protein NEUTE1DRAFT_108276 [Neurospora tetrasperma FGSC 2508]EGZ72764.1 hypothetical protein NEUTE2DRAFT_137206 [Neurospora tetrasperma FGSC 2509]
MHETHATEQRFRHGSLRTGKTFNSNTRSPRGNHDTTIAHSHQNQQSLQQRVAVAQIESIAKDITADHIVIDQWKGITEMTCPAFFHPKNTKKPSKAPAPHKARPYHCSFARSTIGLSKEQRVERLKDAIRQATISNLTGDEKERGAQRQVRIIVWCAEME